MRCKNNYGESIKCCGFDNGKCKSIENCEHRINTSFKKRPVEIDAIQFDGSSEGFDACDDFMDGRLFSDKEVYIKTLEGNMTVSKDDWIIKGVNGEFYPCKPDVFQKSYEKVGR